MNAEISADQSVIVRLSRRNLETLLAQLDSGEFNFLSRSTESGWHVLVIPEEDAVHYQGRQPGPPNKDKYARRDAE